MPSNQRYTGEEYKNWDFGDRSYRGDGNNLPVAAPTTQQVQQQNSPVPTNVNDTKSWMQAGFNGYRDASFERDAAAGMNIAYQAAQQRQDREDQRNDMMMLMNLMGASGFRGSHSGGGGSNVNPYMIGNHLFSSYMQDLGRNKPEGSTADHSAEARELVAKHLAAMGLPPLGGDPNSIESTMSPNKGGWGQAPMQPQEDWRENMQKQMIGALLSGMESRASTPRTLAGMTYTPQPMSQTMTDAISGIRSALASSRASVSPMGIPRKDPSALFSNMDTAGVIAPSGSSEPPFRQSRLGSALQKTALDPMNLTGIGRSLVDTGIHSAKVIGGGVGEIGGILGNAALSSAKTVGGWVGSAANQVKDAYDNNRERIFGTNYFDR